VAADADVAEWMFAALAHIAAERRSTYEERGRPNPNNFPLALIMAPSRGNLAVHGRAAAPMYFILN